VKSIAMMTDTRKWSMLVVAMPMVSIAVEALAKKGDCARESCCGDGRFDGVA
jgi:hypothetical protein